MAKNTAKSKGFRKQEKKKPFLTKKELIALIIIVAVVVAAFAIINWYPTRMFMKANAVKAGDITSYANNNDGTRIKNFFVKLGEIGELEGYTMETSEMGGANQNYSFSPVEESNIDHFEIRGAFGSAVQQIQYIYAAETEDMPFYETAETTLCGLPAYVYAYSSSSYVAPEGEEAKGDEAPNTFTQNVSAYLDYSDAHSIAIHVYLKGDSEDIFVAEEDMVDFITPFADAITVYEGK